MAAVAVAVAATQEEDTTTSSRIMIDETYEFAAPRFYDFIEGETDEEMRLAEVWFDNGLSYAPSPFMPKIKIGRSIVVDTSCDFGGAEQTSKVNTDSSEPTSSANSPSKPVPSESIEGVKVPLISPTEETNTGLANLVQAQNVIVGESVLNENASSIKQKNKPETSLPQMCTPKLHIMANKVVRPTTDSKKCQTVQKIASSIQNPSALKSKNQPLLSHGKSAKAAPVKRDINVKSICGTPSLVQENQAIKRQKLDGGKSRPILNVKPQNLLHKSKPGFTGSHNLTLQSSSGKTFKEDRKIYVREPAVPAVAPFFSTAQMMNKFQTNTRDLSLSHDQTLIHRKPLTLTRPKEPEFETSQRVRLVKIKSSAELEEEMMAKVPKFKARPVNKKILEAPTLPALPRSVPHQPHFQEFHLETMVRANQNAETSSVASAESSQQRNKWKYVEPKAPLLHTSLRSRPPTVKSSFELEIEELEKAPKFKARPLNKKIFESKGELGVSCSTKKQVTIPQEFHFATDERIPQPITVFDLFDKLSLNSEPRHEHPITRMTTPNPFHLYTDERGAEKERKFVMEMTRKQMEEEKARNRRANPYPFSTDYPVIPPKPEPKSMTKPEPFQLESLVRHEEEMQREMEERRRMEKEEAEMRLFKAQPILKEDPIPVPEKVRIPLTEVQEFNLKVDHRAVDRAEFDKKVKEKEMMYKRYRDESESAKLMEEEKALKHLRRTMVPHARPVPKFDHPFIPQKSMKVITKPKSPNLRVVKRKENQKFVRTMYAASSPAAQMR